MRNLTNVKLQKKGSIIYLISKIIHEKRRIKMALFEALNKKIVNTGVKIVLPEGIDERVLTAANRLAAEGNIGVIVLGNKDEINAKAESLNLMMKDITVIDPATSELMKEMIPAFVAKRNGKVTEDQAKEMLKNVNYFGTMLVEMGHAHGLVSGAMHSTADTVRPALQIIKTKPGVKRTSGVFIIFKDNLRFIFADCAINVNPDSEALAEIAVQSAETAKNFGIDPKVAMLSFSSHGSAVTEESTKVANATKLAKEMAPELVIDGEIQFDAAVVPVVAQAKVPNSPLGGNANVFVFPTLDAGNIGYKIAQRFGKFEAVGPVLQGLNRPVNDLSRGCNADDVYYLALITAGQAVDSLNAEVFE